MSTRRSPESRQQAASQAPPSPSSMLGGADRSYQQQTAHAGTGQAQVGLIRGYASSVYMHWRI